MADSKSKFKLIIIILVALIVLGGGGAAGYFFFLKPKENHEPAAETVKAPPALPLYFPLEPFTVNLQSDEPDSEHVLYVGITLEVENEEIRKNLNNYLPEVQTRLIFLLSSKKYEELLTLDGKLKLPEEIKAVLKQPFDTQLSENIIRNVSFTNFILR